MLRRAVVAALFFFAQPAGAQSQAQMAAAYGGVIPQACRGAHVDLAQLSQCECVLARPPVVMKGQTMIHARPTCGDAIEKLAIGAQIDLTVTTAPPQIHSGAPFMVVVSMTNRSHGDLPVVFPDPRPYLVNLLTIVDAHGNDVTRSEQCGMGYSGSLMNYMVVLAPGGVAELRFPWFAATRVVDRACKESHRPLPSGTYALSVPLQLVQVPNAVAHGTMLVQ